MTLSPEIILPKTVGRKIEFAALLLQIKLNRIFLCFVLLLLLLLHLLLLLLPHLVYTVRVSLFFSGLPRTFPQLSSFRFLLHFLPTSFTRFASLLCALIFYNYYVLMCAFVESPRLLLSPSPVLLSLGKCPLLDISPFSHLSISPSLHILFVLVHLSICRRDACRCHVDVIVVCPVLTYSYSYFLSRLQLHFLLQFPPFKLEMCAFCILHIWLVLGSFTVGFWFVSS